MCPAEWSLITPSFVVIRFILKMIVFSCTFTSLAESSSGALPFAHNLGSYPKIDSIPISEPAGKPYGIVLATPKNPSPASTSRLGVDALKRGVSLEKLSAAPSGINTKYRILAPHKNKPIPLKPITRSQPQSSHSTKPTIHIIPAAIAIFGKRYFFILLPFSFTHLSRAASIVFIMVW